MEKTFWQTILGTLVGIDNEGSAKRISMAFICICLLLPMNITLQYCYHKASSSSAPTEAQILVIKSYEEINFSYQITFWMCAGLATLERLTDFIKAIITLIRGSKENIIITTTEKSQ